MTSEASSTCSFNKEISNSWFDGPRATRRYHSHPILPQQGSRNVLITSALPYVNNIPHLGNIVGCVLSADFYARFCRLRGDQTLYICGTDSYGTATECKALEEGISCEEICEKYHNLHVAVYKWFNISFDYFGKTNTPLQTEIAQDIFKKLYDNNYLTRDTCNQLYCGSCNRFLADRFVEGVCHHCNYPDARGDQCDLCGKLINTLELKNPKCKICRSTPEVRNSEHLFLDLPTLQPILTDIINSPGKQDLWSSNAVSTTNSWLKEGLKSRCITRDLKWGTPVPLDDFRDKVFYVWFDAPIGYISITANYTNQWEKWWKSSDVTLINFMAKDNIPFHTVIFPATLIGANDGYITLNGISSTEYLNYEGQKFSKSRNLGVFGTDVINTSIKPDIYRLYLLANRPESHDSSFSWDDLLARNNNEFIGNIGNFINRSLTLLHSRFDGKVQKVELTSDECILISKINDTLGQYIRACQNCGFREAYNCISSICHDSNQYFQHAKPWETEGRLDRVGSIATFSVNIVALLSLLLDPFVPEACEKIRCDIKLEPEKVVIPTKFVKLISDGICIDKPSIYFQKLSPDYIASLKIRFGGQADTFKN